MNKIITNLYDPIITSKPIILPNKELYSIADPLIDLVQGDVSLYKEKLDVIDMNKIKIALDFILNNDKLSNSQKSDLISNSWRVYYKTKPPTPEEFLTFRYLGPTADEIYPRIRTCFLEFFDTTKDYRHAVLVPFIGFGKLQPLTAKVFTPNGITEIGKLKIGEEVSTPNGSFSKITAIYPQGIKELYKITFMDGRSTLSGSEHLWKASKSCNSKQWNKEKKIVEYITPYRLWKVCTTQDIINDFRINPKARWCIPLTSEVYHNENKHIIDPYMMGVLIGDGSIRNKGSVNITSVDSQIVDEVSKLLPPNIELRQTGIQYRVVQSSKRIGNRNYLKSELDRLNLVGTYSYTKFIPKEYLFDSVENRYSLLAGLLDTDGTADKKGKIIFYTSSKQLQEDVTLLVRGLGGIASQREKDRRLTKANTNNIEYLVSIQFKTNNRPLFRLDRKQQRINDNFNRPRIRKGTEFLFIKSIEQVDSAESVCIEIDHPDKLYLTDDYIVTHNSYLSVLINLYIMTHLALMRNPKKFFGLATATTIAFLLISFNLSKAQEVLLEPFQNILEDSVFFERVRTREHMRKSEEEFARSENIEKIYWTTASKNGVSALQFNNNLHVKLASDPGRFVGLSIICATLSELNFFRENGHSDEFIMKIYNNAKRRIFSRFKSHELSRSILDSSPNDITSPLESWAFNEAPLDKTCYVVKGSIWKWVESDFPDVNNTFPIYLGGNGNPPRILTSAEGYNPSDILNVPYATLSDEKGLYQLFHDSLLDSLRDLAGIPQGNMDKLFYIDNKIEACFVSKMKSIEMCLHADAKMNPTGLIWNQIKDQLFIPHGKTYRLYYKPNLPRVIHIDQSVSGDMTAIACAHIERKYDKFTSSIDRMKDIIYVIDFVIPISPYGGRINLDAIRELIIDLISKGNIPVVNASYDTYQSESAIQFLERYGIEMEHLSVDSTLDPYMSLSSLIEMGSLKIGRNLMFKNNLKSLRITKRPRTDTLKVDHTKGDIINPSGADYNWETGLIGLHAKDVSDAVCGAVELAKRYLAVDPASLRELWEETKIILDPEQVKSKNSKLLDNLGFVF